MRGFFTHDLVSEDSVELDIVLAEARSERALDEAARTSRVAFNIAEAVRGLPVDEALIDGEAVVFRAGGKGDFNALLTKARSTGPRSWPSTFCVEKATIYARGPSGRGEGRLCGWS